MQATRSSTRTDRRETTGGADRAETHDRIADLWPLDESELRWWIEGRGRGQLPSWTEAVARDSRKLVFGKVGSQWFLKLTLSIFLNAS